MSDNKIPSLIDISNLVVNNVFGRLINSSNGLDGAYANSSNSSLPMNLDPSNDLLKGDDIIEMSQLERIAWIFAFFSMVLVATGGNLIVIFIVSTNKDMKSVTNYFLVNLSIADAMVSTLNVIFNFISMLNSHWPFGLIYCKISNFISILSISASVFTLTAISCDRYRAILYPLQPRMSHSHAIGWILLIWTLSSLLALPNLIYSALSTGIRGTIDDVATTCALSWPDGKKYPESSQDHIYNILILFFTYLVPIVTMAILYYRVGKELWGYEAIGENIDKQQRALMAKKKIVKMMIVVVIIFALCWLPYHAFFVVNYYFPTELETDSLKFKRLYLVMYWLAMSNSMYNPIIIYFMNSKFQHEIRACISYMCCCRAYQPASLLSSSASGSTRASRASKMFGHSRKLNNTSSQATTTGSGSDEPTPRRTKTDKTEPNNSTNCFGDVIAIKINKPNDSPSANYATYSHQQISSGRRRVSFGATCELDAYVQSEASNSGQEIGSSCSPKLLPTPEVWPENESAEEDPFIEIKKSHKDRAPKSLVKLKIIDRPSNQIKQPNSRLSEADSV